MYFPTICVDEFFSDPLEVRKFALSLEFNKSPANENWPGKRTKPLYDIAPAYFENFASKLFALFYDYRKQHISWNVETYFQMIEPDEYGVFNTGWVHQDNHPMAGIVYLTPDMDVDCGTSLFKPKVPGYREKNLDIKREMYTKFQPDKAQFYLDKVTENNDQFTKVAEFKNQFNRLVAYNATVLHAENKFYGKGHEPRLTQVFFVPSINADWFPIPSSKQIVL
jgi:hypothetical protein